MSTLPPASAVSGGFALPTYSSNTNKIFLGGYWSSPQKEVRFLNKTIFGNEKTLQIIGVFYGNSEYKTIKTAEFESGQSYLTLSKNIYSSENLTEVLLSPLFAWGINKYETSSEPVIVLLNKTKITKNDDTFLI